VHRAAIGSGLALVTLLVGVIVVGRHQTTTHFNPSIAVVPTLREWHGSAGQFELRSGARLVLDPVAAESLQPSAEVIREDLSSVFGIRVSITKSLRPMPGDVFLSTNESDGQLGPEGYTLEIGSVTTIRARTPAGVFYGSRSILQMLLASHSHLLPRGRARDYPQYRERGFMLDVSTRFASISLLEKYIRYLSWFKINDFQLGLNDNGGFRLNSPAFPGLAAADGSYSQREFQDLEKYALARGMAITPEMDGPGHADALTRYRPDLATPGHPNLLNLTLPQSSSFVTSLWRTFLPWFSGPQVAIGADEYDKADGNRYRTYVNFMDDFLHQHGKSVRMWASLSGEPGTIPVHTDIELEQWSNDWSDPAAMARLGFPIINASSEFLYIVSPKTRWFEDRIDSRNLYEHWTPNMFSRSGPTVAIAARDPRLLGALFAFWGDPTLQDTADRVAEATPVFGEKLWNDASAQFNYRTFQGAVAQVDAVPVRA
jgi:glycosyl hydrolase family 20